MWNICNYFEIISKLFQCYVSHVNTSGIEIKLSQPLKEFQNYFITLFQQHWTCWKFSWAAISLWNNFQIILGKLPHAEIILFQTDVDEGWNIFEISVFHIITIALGARGIKLLGCPSVCASCSIVSMLFNKLLRKFHHVDNVGSLGDKCEPIRFQGQKVEGQGLDHIWSQTVVAWIHRLWPWLPCRVLSDFQIYLCQLVAI